MSAPDLLVVIDPAAKQYDAEAVRIARDVLCAGSPGAKVCLPKNAEEATRALARRGGRRPVIVGDDEAFGLAVRQLHGEQQERALGLPGRGPRRGRPGRPSPLVPGPARGDEPEKRSARPRDGDALLACVPVGPPESLVLARDLGLPTDVVSAARTVLGDAERPLGLLMDDRDTVLAGGLRVPCQRVAEPEEERPVSGVLGSLTRRAALVRPVRRYRDAHGVPLPRLRVEADGVLLADHDRPLAELRVCALADQAAEGLVEVVIRPAASALLGGLREEPPPEVRVTARVVTVVGPEGEVRTWRLAPVGLRLTVP